VSGHFHNMHNARWRRVLPLILLCSVVPLTFAGVTSGPLVSMFETRRDLDEAVHLVALTEKQRARLAEFGSLDQLAETDALADRLNNLIPTSLRPIELYSHIRVGAREAGLALRSVRLGEDDDLEVERREDSVFMQRSTVQGTGTLASVERLLGSLRAHGYPTTVLAFSLSRERASQTEFFVELSLGTFHSVVRAEALARDDEDED